MRAKKKDTKYGSEGLFSVILIVLLVIRCVCLDDAESVNAITVVNFVGMTIAFYSLVKNVFSNANGKIIRGVGVILCIIIVISCVIISLLLHFEKISFSDKLNDCITIAALLFALPANLICDLLYGD